MKIYAFPGLGADKRLYRYQLQKFDIKVLEWLNPHQHETLQEYLSRYINQINQNQPFVLMGVSFGGIVAVELSHKINPVKTILISSARTSLELPFFVKYFRYFPIHLLPNAFFTNLGFLVRPFFSIKEKKHKKLFNDMLRSMPPNFMKWALYQIVHWKRDEVNKKIIQIHGTKDLVIPCHTNKDYIINGGGHLMVMEKVENIEKILIKNAL